MGYNKRKFEIIKEFLSPNLFLDIRKSGFLGEEAKSGWMVILYPNLQNSSYKNNS